MYRHLLVASLALFCIAQVLSEKTTSVADCPRELERVRQQNAELAVRLRNATDYIEQFTREFNNFFNEFTATRRPAAAAAAASASTRPPARRP